MALLSLTLHSQHQLPPTPWGGVLLLHLPPLFVVIVWFSVAQGSSAPAHHRSPVLLQSAPTQAVGSRKALPPQTFPLLEVIFKKITDLVVSIHCL